MARILYGVSGEGMGHAFRSKAIIDELKKKHDIVIVSSNRAYDFLKKHYEKVFDVHGLHIHYEDNEVKNFATLMENTARLPEGTVKTIRQMRKVVREFSPELCITDYEPFTCYISRIRRLPCIAIDNVNVLRKTKIHFDEKFRRSYRIARTVSRMIVPEADHFLLTTFFFPHVKRKNTMLFMPIIRKEIIDAEKKLDIKKGEHILVYQTSSSNEHLLEVLKTLDEKFIVYGFDIDKKDKNLEFKKFSFEGFVKDLAESKGVITNGGYTLISEAIYLKKPILSEPVRKQFEQILNATYIQKDGYGLFTEKISREDILKFLANLPKYKKKLEKFEHDDNRKLFRKLDDLIQRLTKKA